MSYPRKSLLLSGLALGLLIGNSQANAFDPKKALEQHKAKQPTEQQVIYERYRNKQEARIYDDGTVSIGNMFWMRCSLGQQWDGTTCTGNTLWYQRDDAQMMPGLMNAQGGFAGHSDWRLPTATELASLRVCSSGEANLRYGGTISAHGGTTFQSCDGDYSSPTLDTNLFPETPGGPFWGGPWYINFKFGSISSGNASDRAAVRLVRRGRI